MLSAWLVTSPDRVVSRVMTWDLLFNLAGAWHLQDGQVAHVDFHDPVGGLYFWPTVAGFWLGGPTVKAFVVGQLIVTAALFVAATMACVRRLPSVPASVFVLFVCLLVLMPTNVGDLVDDFTFAMSYNAYGWAGLCIVSLILFLPPREGAGVAWTDAAVGGLLIVALYYLKVTYFLAALGELGIAFLVCRHIRDHRMKWGLVGMLIVVNAVAPWNWAYLGDIQGAIETGAIRTHLRELVIVLSANVPELSLYGTLFLVTVALWRSGRAPLRLPAAAGLLIVEGVAVLSQNAQLRGLPLCLVAVFLLYDHLRRDAAAVGRQGSTWVLLAILVFPAASVVAQATSMAFYYKGATSGAPLFVVERTNLRGLAVPFKPDGMRADSARGADYTWLTRSRSIGASPRLSQFDYVQSLLEAASLFGVAEGRPGGIVLLDQVNPLPFMLDRRPPRGGNLWLDTGFPWPSAETMFRDANYVLIPKLSTAADVTREAVRRYGAYLARYFPLRSESPGWTLLSRRPAPR